MKRNNLVDVSSLIDVSFWKDLSLDQKFSNDFKIIFEELSNHNIDKLEDVYSKFRDLSISSDETNFLKFLKILFLDSPKFHIKSNLVLDDDNKYKNLSDQILTLVLPNYCSSLVDNSLSLYKEYLNRFNVKSNLESNSFKNLLKIGIANSVSNSIGGRNIITDTMVVSSVINNQINFTNLNEELKDLNSFYNLSVEYINYTKIIVDELNVKLEYNVNEIPKLIDLMIEKSIIKQPLNIDKNFNLKYKKFLSGLTDLFDLGKFDEISVKFSNYLKKIDENKIETKSKSSLVFGILLLNPFSLILILDGIFGISGIPVMVITLVGMWFFCYFIPFSKRSPLRKVKY